MKFLRYKCHTYLLKILHTWITYNTGYMRSYNVHSLNMCDTSHTYNLSKAYNTSTKNTSYIFNTFYIHNTFYIYNTFYMYNTFYTSIKNTCKNTIFLIIHTMHNRARLTTASAAILTKAHVFSDDKLLQQQVLQKREAYVFAVEAFF